MGLVLVIIRFVKLAHCESARVTHPAFVLCCARVDNLHGDGDSMEGK